METSANKQLLAAIVLGCVLFAAIVGAEPEPEPKAEAAKGRRSSYFNEPASAKFRAALPEPEEHLVAELRQAAVVDAIEDDDDDVEDAAAAGSAPQKGAAGDASSGRLFLKKFLLFKNIFGGTSQQPVIPIIITGGTGVTNPTTTITSTGTIPTATGTITTAPATRVRADEEEGEAEAAEELAAMNEQALQAALAAGAQEYVVTDEEIKGTSDSKATKPTNRINLKRKGGRKGQVISVRIPPRYQRYFKNGQKVMLNTGGGNNNNNNAGKRRVVRKRVNQVRRRKNNKTKRRIVGA